MPSSTFNKTKSKTYTTNLRQAFLGMGLYNSIENFKLLSGLISEKSMFKKLMKNVFFLIPGWTPAGQQHQINQGQKTDKGFQTQSIDCIQN